MFLWDCRLASKTRSWRNLKASAFFRMCPVRRTGRWQGLRWFLARDWLVYYDYVPADDTIYVRNLWPARALPP
jgi:hypothetical protein